MRTTEVINGDHAREYEILREYIPMRDWEVEVHGVVFSLMAEVEQDEDGNITCSDVSGIVNEYGDDWAVTPEWMLSSTPKDASDTWQTLIERAVCEDAAKSDGWKHDLADDPLPPRY
jgi:hypothetical protein